MPPFWNFVHSAAIFGPNSAVEYANILQLHCLCKSSTQLVFVFDKSGLLWIWKEKFLLWVVDTIAARRNISNDGPSSSEWGLTKPIFMNQKFWMARCYYGSPIIISRYISNRKINGRKNRLQCRVVSWDPRRRNGQKVLPEKLLRPPDNPPNLPSVQNNRFLLSGVLHFFPFSGQSPEFWCRTIYGTLYYLPHLLTFPRKGKSTKFTILYQTFAAGRDNTLVNIKLLNKL